MKKPLPSAKQRTAEARFRKHNFAKVGNYYAPKNIVEDATRCLAYGMADHIEFELALKKLSPGIDIVSVDGTPSSVDWHKNLKDPPCRLDASVYAEVDGTTPFYKQPGNGGCHSLINMWGSEAIVDTVVGKTLRTLLDQLGWKSCDILKADIEGYVPKLVDELCREGVYPRVCIFEFEHMVERGADGYEKRIDMMEASLNKMTGSGYTVYLNRWRAKRLTEVICVRDSS